jgi:hypothetical protein
MQLSAEFAKILLARAAGAQVILRVTRNFSGNCAESAARA